jgi:hypothetical protein
MVGALREIVAIFNSSRYKLKAKVPVMLPNPLVTLIIGPKLFPAPPDSAEHAELMPLAEIRLVEPQFPDVKIMPEGEMIPAMVETVRELFFPKSAEVTSHREGSELGPTIPFQPGIELVGFIV